MDKLKEIQTQINSHTMENIHTMLGEYLHIFTAILYTILRALNITTL